MIITIRHYITGAVLYETDVDDTRIRATRRALERASLYGASLDGARLDGARLDGASLDGARLDGASLDGARLDGASLDGARLDGASLDGASLVGASLDGASLYGARLDGASLDGASLVGASLDGASLVGASLDGARLDGASLDGARQLLAAGLTRIKLDLFDVLDKAPAEVPGLLAALRDGTIDGSAYEGDCACLVGTIAKVRGCSYDNLVGLRPNGSRPAERWCLAIRPGATPDNHPVAEVTAMWIAEWQAAHAPAPPPVEAKPSASSDVPSA